MSLEGYHIHHLSLICMRPSISLLCCIIIHRPCLKDVSIPVLVVFNMVDRCIAFSIIYLRERIRRLRTYNFPTYVFLGRGFFTMGNQIKIWVSKQWVPRVRAKGQGHYHTYPIPYCFFQNNVSYQDLEWINEQWVPHVHAQGQGYYHTHFKTVSCMSCYYLEWIFKN